MSVTYEASFATRGATGLIFQCHQILHLQTKWLSWLMSVTYETSFTMRGATGVIHQRHQVLLLPRKMTRIIDPRDICNVIYNARSDRCQPPTSPNIAPATQNCIPKSKRNLPQTVERHWYGGRFENDPNMIRARNYKTEPARSPSLLFPPRQRILYWKLQHFALRLSTQISPNTAPATKSDTPTSPNAVPATQNDSHEWCPSHMKRHLQCAEQQDSSSNVTKYCTCHIKWLSWLMSVTYETSFTMRGATGLIFQWHQILHLQIKWDSHDWCPSHMKRHLQRAEQQDSSSNVTKYCTCKQNDSHDWCPSHMKRHLQRAEQQDSSSNVTKYCTCHVKWLSWLMSVTYETSFTMRGATGITLQPHQILRLPRKIAFQNLREICRKKLNDIYMADDSTMTRPWSEHDPTMKLQNWTRPFAELTFPPSATQFVLKITTFRTPAIYPDFTEYCACRKKWHSKITMQMLRLPRKVTLQDHQILPLPRKMNWNFTELLLYWAGTLLYWTVTLLKTSFTMRLIFQCHQILHLPR